MSERRLCAHRGCFRPAHTPSPWCRRCGQLRRQPPARPQVCIRPDCGPCAEILAAWERRTRCRNPACPDMRDWRRGIGRCGACQHYWRRHRAERPAWLTRPAEVARPVTRCIVAYCLRPQCARGWCRTHYHRWHEAVRRARAADRPTPCLNPACGQPAHHRFRGHCPACYMYLWRHGVERPERLTHPRARPCVVVGCERLVSARERCATHYHALWRAERRAQLTAAS